MKYIFSFPVVLLFCFSSFAQSPYLSVKATVLPLKSINYKIEMKICKPKKLSQYKDIFGHDTSALDFQKLAAKDFECGDYFESNHEAKDYNEFSWGNQQYAYESIIVLKFSDESSRAWHKPMYIVLPIRYQSFVTFVELSDITVTDGKVLYLDNIEDTRNKDGYLMIKQSLLKSAPPKDKYNLRLNLD